MRPEKVLQSLFDSREQPHLGPNQHSRVPTRIRVLQALQAEDLSIPSLAETTSITRQTVYRALDPLKEAGLVRTKDGLCTLTCSGGCILREYSQTAKESDGKSLARLTRSPHQRWILDALHEEPLKKTDLLDRAGDQEGPSRTTIHRIVGKLLRDGYVDQIDREYTLTEAGERLLRDYEKLRSKVLHALEHREFLQWLPAELDSFPLEALGGATTIRNSLEQPHNILNAYVSAAGINFERFHGMGSIRSPALDHAYSPVMRDAASATAIFTDEILYQFHRDSEFVDFVTQRDYSSYLRDGFVTDSAQFLFVEGTLPLHIAIYDEDRAILAPAPSTGVAEVEAAAIDSTDPRIVEWALEIFNEHYERARPPIEVFQDRRSDDSRDVPKTGASSESATPTD